MQRVTFRSPHDPQPQPDNRWFAGRQKYHVRNLYSLFYKAHTTFTDNDIHSFAAMNSLMTANNKGDLWQLKKFSTHLFSKNSPYNQYGQHLNWALHALFYATVKLKENLKMSAFHNQGEEEIDPGHATFMETILQESQQQRQTIELLFDNARNLLQFMLIEQTENDLLLRLLIEEEEISQTLWNKSTQELFCEMFPHQPEAGYVLAGKSYFMAGWLEEALKTYEISLTINKNLSEPRRQTYLIRAMIKDRDGAE